MRLVDKTAPGNRLWERSAAALLALKLSISFLVRLVLEI